MKQLINFFNKEEKQKRAMNSVKEIIANYYQNKKVFLNEQKRMLKKGYTKEYILEQYAAKPTVKIATVKERIFYPEQFAAFLSKLFNVNISPDRVYYGKVSSEKVNCYTLQGENSNYRNSRFYTYINVLLCRHEGVLYGVELSDSLRKIIFIDEAEVKIERPDEFRILVKKPSFVNSSFYHYFLCYKNNAPEKIVRTYKFGSYNVSEMEVILWQHNPTASRIQVIIENL